MPNTKQFIIHYLQFIIYMLLASFVHSQTAMMHVGGRKTINLDGKWQAIIDPTGTGEWRQVWLEKKPEKKTDFLEYAFEGAPVLNVPADFNTQLPELSFYEGVVWYKRSFDAPQQSNKRYFVHFGAVNYLAHVYLNGELLGKHEGGFTPFQFEVTDKLKTSNNSLIVKVDNKRLANGIPSTGYDWMNYGGITREVSLIETPRTYIADYFIQLKKTSPTEVSGWVQLNGKRSGQTVRVKIPELGINNAYTSNTDGLAAVQFSGKWQLWSPENPHLYQVVIESESDTISDLIGFRNIETKGTQILLNGKAIFLKGVNIHEENPLRGAKAYSESDARQLLTWAKELGCNFVRLSHYPHSEHMVRLAEKMGLLVWSEIPVYQHIQFSDPEVPGKMSTMLQEMIQRDRNRCAVFIWCVANETYHTTPDRDVVLTDMAKQCRRLDDTRLITSVMCNQGYQNNEVNVWDPLYKHFDVVSVNEYFGWYGPWQGKPKDVKWKLVCPDKPLIISEFGGEAQYGSNHGPKDEAAWWSEEYQEQIYKDQIEMFSTTPNLRGVCPWILVDYRSLGRMHPVYQGGWNRKGLLSDREEKKKAWYIFFNYKL